jgi:hypothetical protein
MEFILLEIIKKKINHIIDGYNVIPDSRVADGCDKYGYLYWVDCYNGFSGREHEISSIIKKSLNKIFFRINFEGIIYKSNKYYIDSKFIKNYRNLLINDIKILKPDEIINKKLNYNIYNTIYYKIALKKSYCGNIQLYSLELFKKSLFDYFNNNKEVLYNYLNNLNLNDQEKKIIDFPNLNWIKNSI